MVWTGRTLLTFSFSSDLVTHSLFPATSKYPFVKTLSPRVLLRFRPLCSSASTTTTIEPKQGLEPVKHSILLERLRLRHLKDSVNTQQSRTTPSVRAVDKDLDENSSKKTNLPQLFSSFGELGLSENLMSALGEFGISVPTEIQGLGIPAVLEGKSVVLGSHTGSGKTLAYLLPLVQLLRRDEELHGMLMKPRRPRAVVLCPTRELCEQVFRVSKSISHHARFRSTMVSGGTRLKPQEDSLNVPIDMVVGTPGRVLQHIEEGNMVYGDIKYLVLDEADTMFDHGFGPDIRKFLGPLRNRALKSDDEGFQTVLVTATMTMAVQKLVDEEFQGIIHLRTSTLHKKITSARHDFIKISGAENKLEALLQVLEPSLSKGNRVMVFCNSLQSSRAVYHYLSENEISTLDYDGKVPAEERVENLKKFKSDDGDCPTLVCSDLAARGLDLDVDHVIMFDFPQNSIDYLHRTGRTARMGAKGKVTSLVAKKDLTLATRIEEAIRKNESLESLSADRIKTNIARARISGKGKSTTSLKTSNKKNMIILRKSIRGKVVPVQTFRQKNEGAKAGKTSAPFKVRQTIAELKTSKSSRTASGGRKQADSRKSVVTASSSRSVSSGGRKQTDSGKSSSSRSVSSGGRKQTYSGKSGTTKPSPSKLNVVGFRGRSSSFTKRESFLCFNQGLFVAANHL